MVSSPIGVPSSASIAPFMVMVTGTARAAAAPQRSAAIAAQGRIRSSGRESTPSIFSLHVLAQRPSPAHAPRRRRGGALPLGSLRLCGGSFLGLDARLDGCLELALRHRAHDLLHRLAILEEDERG